MGCSAASGRVTRKRDFAWTGVDGQVLNEVLHGAGASVVGRRMYDITNGWGGRSPFGPCVVVTHRVDEQPDRASGFEFVDGVGPAIVRARELAGDKETNIGGGASVVQQVWVAKPEPARRHSSTRHTRGSSASWPATSSLSKRCSMR